jgi:hypothetical protein
MYVNSVVPNSFSGQLFESPDTEIRCTAQRLVSIEELEH